jgi:hypothetical protein
MHVPAILVDLRSRTLQRFADLAAQLLDQSDDALFNLAQRSRGGSEQQDHLDAMRHLRKQRGEVVNGFAAAVANALALVPEPTQQAPATELDAAQLSLIGVDALEEQLAQERLAQAVARRHSEPLLRFGAALARIWERDSIDEDSIPLAPARLAAALGRALHPVELPVASRLVVFKLFERLLLESFGQLLTELNQFLHSRGIAEAAAPAPGLRRAPRPAAARTYAPRQDPETAEDDDREFEPTATAAHSEALSPSADAWFATMCEIFANYLGTAQPAQSETAGGPAPGSAGAAHPRPALPGPVPTGVEMLPRERVFEVLRAFQLELPRGLRRAAVERSVALGEQLKVELLVEGQRGGGHGRRLHPADEQALTLVGMLFDVLFDQSHFSDQLRGLLVRLLPAYAQIALHDPQLFAQRSHPARRLLNALTEAGEGNLGDSPGERDALMRITAVVDRVSREYQGDIGLLVDLEARFGKLVEQQKRRAALAERRTADSQRGRERLEDARTTASLEVSALAAGQHPAPPFDEFLRRDWGHHLTVTLLRAGEDSEDYAQARRIGVLLWQTIASCRSGGGIPESLREGLLQVDASTGRHRSDDVLAALTSLRSASLAPQPAGIEPPHPGERVPADSLPAAAPEPAAEAQAPEPADTDSSAAQTHSVDAAAAPTSVGFQIVGKVGAKPELPTGDIELCIDPAQVQPGDIAKVRALKQGSWVDLIDAHGESQAAKLSWISPISQRMLFVNRSGTRLCLLSPPECAALITQHKLVPRAAEEAFDRAMVGLLDRLRSERRTEAVAASAEAPAHPPAST